MLSRELVGLQLARLGVALHRKVDARMVEVYWGRLSVHLEDDAFNHACEYVIDEGDDRFPTVATLLKAARSSHRSHERGVPYVVDANRQEIGALSEVLSSLDSGRMSGTGADQFRGRPGVMPMIERLVYEDAVVTTPVVQTDQLTDRLRRISLTAEAELARLVAASAPAPTRGA